jgi:outer membrane protein TolC
MRTRVNRISVAAILAVFGMSASVFAQLSETGLQQVATSAPGVRRLTVDEAVKLALENNLGIRVARIDPQLQDLNIVNAKSGWTPSLSTTLQTNSQDAPNQNFLAGAQGTITSSDQFTGNLGVTQLLPWGGSYDVGWDNTRFNSNSSFATFSPQLRSSFVLNYSQPLLRNRGIDNTRQQVQITSKNREIADVTTRQTVAVTTRTVRNAFWDLAYTIASLAVQRQSLDLAQESLRDTKARVEIGTQPPIDIVEAEAEVARRQEAVIVAEGQIGDAEDALRRLVFDPDMPDFWTVKIEPADLPAFEPIKVDTDTAVRNALSRRTDLEQSRKSIEADEINIRFYRNQTMPDVSASLNYGLQGLGGTQLERGDGPFGRGTGEVIGSSQRSFGGVLSDLFANAYPNWTAGVTISYPIGTSTSEANLARVQLERTQRQTRLRDQEVQIVTQVRGAAREVQTNQQRVESSRSARQLAERRLEAEQRKFEAGTSTTFLVFQAQRDLSQARNVELQNVLNFHRSVIDLETVQDVPPQGGGATQGTGTAQGGAQTGTVR